MNLKDKNIPLVNQRRQLENNKNQDELNEEAINLAIIAALEQKNRDESIITLEGLHNRISHLENFSYFIKSDSFLSYLKEELGK